ncbi:MAG TPA: hypothetical protein DCW90_05270 [Lachnospiraceae bacterium]|nr:hypothetical protein [Lachnospiraceae bacterium]
MVEREYKIIFNAGCARNLLKNGVPIYDIKPDKNNPEKTLFVFKRTDEFERVFSEINRGIEERRQGE